MLLTLAGKARLELLICFCLAILLLVLGTEIECNRGGVVRIKVTQENVPEGVALIITSSITYLAGHATGACKASLVDIIGKVINKKM